MNPRPTVLLFERNFTPLQRAFWGIPLPPPRIRWNKISSATLNPLFRGVSELPIWVIEGLKQSGIGNPPTSAITIGYLTRTMYDNLLTYPLSTPPTGAIINDGIAISIGREAGSLVILIDAYFGVLKRLRGGDGGDNLTPCKIPAP